MPEVVDCRLQERAATRPVPLVGYGHAINGVVRITLDNCAVAVQRAREPISHPGNSDSADREMGSCDARHRASMVGGVV